MNRWSIVAAMGIAAVAGCSTQPHGTTEKNTTTPKPQESAEVVTDKQVVAIPTEGPSPAELDEYYHLPEGGELLPLDMIRAVENTKTSKPFMEDLERFRLIADPKDPDGLPVGMSVAMVNGKRAEPRMVFFNCAACHTGELTYHGQKLRIEGAPAHFDLDMFVNELIGSFKATLADPQKLAGFLERLANQKAMGLAKAYPDLKLPGDKIDKKDFFAKVARFQEEKKKLQKTISAKVADVKLRVESVDDAVEFLHAQIKYLEGLKGLQRTTVPGFGRLDAFTGTGNLLFGEKYGLGLNAPVSLPSIYGLSKLTWYHYDNNTTTIVQRNIGQALGMGAVVNKTTWESKVEFKNLLRLETLASKFLTPKWPEGILGAIDIGRTTRGAAIYKKKCANCHDAGEDGMFPDRTFALDKIGTDPNRALNFAKMVGDKSFAQSLHGVLEVVQNKAVEQQKLSAAELAKMERAKVEWRGTKEYASRPLAGIWASGPYLHNGSVPTLYDLLLPPDKRPKTFQTGSREFDPKKVGYVHDGTNGGSFQFDTSKDGNHNTGHTFGTELSEDERMDLIEYLKGL